MTNQQLEQIEKYHSGQMSESEMIHFENQLASDPALKAESNLQSDIVNGLKEFRKAELKARLDAVNVGPTWLEFAGQSALMKSLGGVIVASLIGTGIYFIGEKSETPEISNTITIEAPVKESVEYVWELGEEEISATASNELEKPEFDAGREKQSNRPENIEDFDTKGQNENQVAMEEKVKVFAPSFEAPSAADIEEEGKFESSGLDELPESSDVVDVEEPIDVETESTRSSTIKYKYYDGKLFLSGDFDKAPYEILEINNAQARRIYVYYLGTFYQVNTTDRLTTLPIVKDRDVVKELELLRENK